MKPLILCLLSGACLFADTVTTNTQSRFFRAVNMESPLIPPVLKSISGAVTSDIYFATNVPLVHVLFEVDRNASNVIAIKMPGYALETVTNWTDFVPSGFSTSTTLQDHNMGVEFGLIVTNRVMTFIEPDGYTTNIVIRSWTNQDATLNRTYRKTRTYDTNGVHVRNWTRVRVP